ncbi:hypothetical protein BDB00DRAFT_937164 [Zychaea mexicana]|uniref:uncharacterized protein n=1 Tax=Zychaea mexicana TaxID=64656 RepID=UPI0022FECB74|nr:uncharacterized protein BDB00DRAFT_937164 [Zychaea mexicana]KAI9496111.1 hypothetical protein BDB00DRAFT_937164 [Zychaea mexicana]
MNPQTPSILNAIKNNNDSMLALARSVGSLTREVDVTGGFYQKSFLNAIRHYQALHKSKHVFFQNKGCVAVDIKHRRLFKAPSVIVGRRRRVATAQCVALFKPRETTSRKRARSCDGSANDFTDSTSVARVGARYARGVRCCGRVGN